MDYATTFYVLGGVLAVLAVVTSFAGLRFEKFPGRYGPLVVLLFVAIVVGATTFAVLNGQDEQEARAQETAQAGEEIEKEESAAPVEASGESASEAEQEAGEGEEAEPAPGEEGEAAGEEQGGQAPQSQGAPAPGAKEGGGQESGGKQAGGKKPTAAPVTLQLAADPTQIAFDKTTLASKPGKVTIEFTNPSALEHDVAIEKDGKQIVVSPLISEGKTSVSAELTPGTYTFLCTVPGHAEAGMEGTLTVK